jgi:hypothetical protein
MHRVPAAAAAAAFAVAASAVAPAQVPETSSMNEIAERYVKLVLDVGQHDDDYVDAFYGPPEWKQAASRHRRPLQDLAAEARSLVSQLPSTQSDADELVELRRQYLRRQLESLESRVQMLSGTRVTFDEESRALYDAVAPVHSASDFEPVLNDLEALLPGPGEIIDRYDRFRQDFIIPTDRLSSVFERAIEECRSRTARYIPLPAGETFKVEYVTNKAWSGYNWYQGGYHSLIQVNTDLPIYVDRAVDLACHEGYPGHHVYNALLEKHLVRDRGWQEFTVYALFSPQSLIAEGTANYGIEVTFPGEQRTAFERDVLFPLAGLDAARASTYYRALALADRLAYAGNEAARGYLNGSMTRDQAVDWLTRYALMSRPRAEQRTRFMDQYRSYVINYNLGKDLVKTFIEARAAGSSERRWSEFTRLISSPRLPSALQNGAGR